MVSTGAGDYFYHLRHVVNGVEEMRIATLLPCTSVTIIIGNAATIHAIGLCNIFELMSVRGAHPGR